MVLKSVQGCENVLLFRFALIDCRDLTVPHVYEEMESCIFWIVHSPPWWNTYPFHLFDSILPSMVVVCSLVHPTHTHTHTMFISNEQVIPRTVETFGIQKFIGPIRPHTISTDAHTHSPIFYCFQLDDWCTISVYTFIQFNMTAVTLQHFDFDMHVEHCRSRFCLLILFAAYSDFTKLLSIIFIYRRRSHSVLHHFHSSPSSLCHSAKRHSGLHNNESWAFYLLCKSDFIHHKCCLNAAPPKRQCLFCTVRPVMPS